VGTLVQRIFEVDFSCQGIRNARCNARARPNEIDSSLPERHNFDPRMEDEELDSSTGNLMANVIIIPERIYRKRGYMDETERQFITADQLYDVLNSAWDDGTTQEYVLLEDNHGNGK
jgi:hypothetical protein